jgi:predicted nucleic acid-binding protein
MKRAYVDTSALVAIHFGERGAAKLATFLRAQEELLSAAFTSAELLSTLAREGRSLREAEGLLKRISLFAPDGPLQAECEEALAVGPLRGADLWHVAAALALAGQRSRKALTFCTLDAAQGAVASKLGFPVIP